MKKLVKRLLSLKSLQLLLIFCLSFVVFKWTKGNEVINGNDTNYPLLPARYFKQRLYQWNHTLGGGIDFAHGLAGLTWHGLQAVPSLFKLPLHLSQKTFLFFIFNAISFSFYFFISALLPKNKLAQLLGVVFYCFNPYLFNLWGNIQSANLCAYILIPLGSGFLVRSLQKKDKLFPKALIFGILSALFSAFASNPQVLAVVLLYFFLFIMFIFVENVLRLKSVSFSFFIKTIFAYLFIYLLFNLFWIIPEVSVLISSNLALNIPQSSDLRGWLDFVSANTGFVNVIRLQGEWMWYQSHKGMLYVPFAESFKSDAFLIFWSFTSFIISVIVIIKSKNKWLVLFSLLLLIGLFASMGTKPPFGYLYLFLTQKIKAFSFLRSPWYKFSLLTALAYGVLAAFFVELFEHKKGTVLSLALILGQIVYCYPLINGEVFPTNSALPYKYEIPNYIWGADEYLNWDLQESKVVMLPRQGDLDYYQWGGNSSAQFLNLTANPKPVLTEPSWTVLGDTNINQTVRAFYDYLYEGWSEEAIKIISPLNVKYLLHKRDFNYNYDNDLGSPAFVEGKLNSLKYLEDPSLLGPWYYYKIKKDKITPFIFASNRVDLVNAEPYLLADYFLIKDKEAISVSGVNSPSVAEPLGSLVENNYEIGLLKEEILNFQPPTPYIRVSPFSFFYSYIRAKEEKELSSVSNQLERTVKLMFFGNKRIKEIQKVLAGGNEKNLQKIVKLTNDYLNNALEAEKILNDFKTSGSRKEIEYLQTIKYYGDDNLKNLKKFSNNGTDVKETLEISERLLGLTSFNLNQLFSTQVIKRYEIFIPEDGSCELKLLLKKDYASSKEILISEIRINDEIKNDSDIKLSENNLSLGEYFLKKGSNSISLFFTDVLNNNPSLVAVSKNADKKEGLILPGIQFKQISPAKYEISVDGAKDKFILVFLENYHPWWQARIIKKDTNKAIFLDTKNHIKVNGFANGWILDDKGDFKVIIEYKSQKTYTFLLYFLGFLLILSSVYLIKIVFRRKDEKYK